MKNAAKKSENGNGDLSELLKELWNVVVALRGNIEPAEYKRYGLPLVFFQFLDGLASNDNRGRIALADKPIIVRIGDLFRYGSAHR